MDIQKVKYNEKAMLYNLRVGWLLRDTLRHEIDFNETFSSVLHFSSIRTLLALAVQKDMIVHQMDVVTAFPNGKLDEEIYI